MITREQLEHERRIQVASWIRCHPESRESVENLLKVIDLAIRAIDQEEDAKLGARLRSILLATGHDADSLESAEGEPSRAGLADFVLRLADALREEGER